MKISPTVETTSQCLSAGSIGQKLTEDLLSVQNPTQKTLSGAIVHHSAVHWSVSINASVTMQRHKKLGKVTRAIIPPHLAHKYLYHPLRDYPCRTVDIRFWTQLCLGTQLGNHPRVKFSGGFTLRSYWIRAWFFRRRLRGRGTVCWFQSHCWCWCLSAYCSHWAGVWAGAQLWALSNE